MRKTLIIAALAFGVLVTAPGVALANHWTNFFTWPAKGFEVHVRLDCQDNVPFPGEDRCWGEFGWVDDGPDDLNKLVLSELVMMIDRAPKGGPAVVLRGSLDDGQFYTSRYGYAFTTTAACMHEDQFPQDIRQGDTVWIRAKYYIDWNAGANTALRSDQSPHITISQQAHCT